MSGCGVCGFPYGHVTSHEHYSHPATTAETTPAPDPWDGPEGQTHSVGDACPGGHQESAPDAAKCAIHTFVSTAECGCVKKDAPPAPTTEGFEMWHQRVAVARARHGSACEPRCYEAWAASRRATLEECLKKEQLVDGGEWIAAMLRRLDEEG